LTTVATPYIQANAWLKAATPTRQGLLAILFPNSALTICSNSADSSLKTLKLAKFLPKILPLIFKKRLWILSLNGKYMRLERRLQQLQLQSSSTAVVTLSESTWLMSRKVGLPPSQDKECQRQFLFWKNYVNWIASQRCSQSTTKVRKDI